MALLAGALAALTALPVSEAAAADIILRAAAGIGQVVKADRWMPVVIDLDSPASFNGELLVSWGDVRVRRSLVLPSAGPRRFEIYLRTPEPTGTVRVGLFSRGHEIKAIDAPVRVVPSSDPVTLCLVRSEPSRQDGCVHVSSDSLPRSPRAFDAVDRIDVSEAAMVGLSTDQRHALLQSAAIHAVDQSGDSGLVNRPSRPGQRPGLPAGVMKMTGVVTVVFVICFAGTGLSLARRRVNARWLWLSATAIVVAATSAAQAIGTLGPGASITVYQRTLLEQVLGTDVSVLSMRGLAEFPAHASFVLRLPVTDGTLEPSSPDNEPAEQLLDESGQPVLAGVFGLASRKAFVGEGIVSSPLAVSQHGTSWTVTNRSVVTLDQCRFREGFSHAAVVSMPPGHSVVAQETGKVFGPAFTCETHEPVVAMISPDRTVNMKGTTVIAVYAGRQAIPTAGVP